MIKLVKKNKPILKSLGVLIIIFMVANYVTVVYRYGNFNPFASPNRVVINGFRFHKTDGTVSFYDDIKPKYEISNIMDRITGKRIYSTEKDFKASPGNRVFLKINENEYIRLQCGGGA